MKKNPISLLLLIHIGIAAATACSTRTPAVLLGLAGDVYDIATGHVEEAPQ